MRYYYENTNGDCGVFSEKDIIKAIYSAWNIEADLYVIPPRTTLKDIENRKVKLDLIFAPWEDNEVNSELLEKYGYYECDNGDERSIFRISDDKLMYVEWSNVRRLN